MSTEALNSISPDKKKPMQINGSGGGCGVSVGVPHNPKTPPPRKQWTRLLAPSSWLNHMPKAPPFLSSA